MGDKNKDEKLFRTAVKMKTRTVQYSTVQYCTVQFTCT